MERLPKLAPGEREQMAEALVALRRVASIDAVPDRTRRLLNESALLIEAMAGAQRLGVVV